MPRARREPSSRFWEHVRRTEDVEACWPWVGATATNDAGEGTYGIFNAGDRTVTAHTFAFDLTRPNLDRTGLVVRHTCDNPLCVNPRHLRLGTHADNTRDMDERGRRVNNPARGEAHHSSKMTAETVVEARMLYNLRALGWSIKSLAEKYNVSETAMRAVINRRSWNHV